MKLITIFGTRPQFIKSCLISKKLKENKINEVLIHTGQHYDKNMSSIFFKNLKINIPDYNLNINNKTHGSMTGQMIIQLEEIIINENPDCIIVYGDCNTTISGALVACKLDIPIIHIESGLRSYDKKMPEEINRIVTDHISNYLMCPTKNAVENLKKEGITSNVFLTGDLMVELLRENISSLQSNYCYSSHNLKPKTYYLATVHRQSNTTPENISKILNTFNSQKFPVLFCVHPRTKAVIDENNITIPQRVICIEPTGFLEILSLLYSSRALFTDSGGLQKEAYELKIPCFTLRESTEWKELIDIGWNILGFPDNTEESIKKILKLDHPLLYPEDTSDKIVSIIKKCLKF
jgi:UDP-N-acetylglucosamine 2-epimerase